MGGECPERARIQAGRQGTASSYPRMGAHPAVRQGQLLSEGRPLAPAAWARGWGGRGHSAFPSLAFHVCCECFSLFLPTPHLPLAKARLRAQGALGAPSSLLQRGYPKELPTGPCLGTRSEKPSAFQPGCVWAQQKHRLACCPLGRVAHATLLSLKVPLKCRGPQQSGGGRG